MKVIKSDSLGDNSYQQLFIDIQTSYSKVVIWQLDPGTSKRNVIESKLNSYSPEIGLLYFNLSSNDKIESELPLYFYSELGQLLFKSQIEEMRSDIFSIRVPSEMKVLEEDDLDELMSKININLKDTSKTKGSKVVIHQSRSSNIISMSQRSNRDQDFLNNEFNDLSLDEEDKFFADKRESPRARPKIDKWVRLVSESSEEVHLFRLFDLSRGGIGFITMELALFPKGSVIKVVGFEDHDLDHPLYAQVVSQRSVDELEIEFKVGCRFEEGQS